MSGKRILVELVFLTAEEGGRQKPPTFEAASVYRPHLVVQGRDVRETRMRERNVIDEIYLGVSFIGGPKEFFLGELIVCTLRLDYYPSIEYADLKNGASFTLREGCRIVGHGTVLEQRAS